MTMVTCGHQFHMGDECDWLISSSAVCPINGTSSATKILKELIEAHCKTRIEESQKGFGEVREIRNDVNKLDVSFYLQPGDSRLVLEESGHRKDPELVLEAREIALVTPQRKTKSKEHSRSRHAMPAGYDSDDFDENQHLDGCPIKWYYRKRTKNGWGPCVALKRNKEDTNRGGKKYRDRIPLEVKIGKISLNKREPFSEFRNVNGTKRLDTQNEASKYKPFEIDPSVVELQKKRLAAKLNWRPFQEKDDREESELSYDKKSSVRSGDGYLRPRSALGGKFPVSILLFPYHQRNNCSCGRVGVKEGPKVKPERATSAYHNPKQSHSSDARSSKVSRPKTTQSLRWGSKTQRKGKKLQLPKQMNVSFDAPKKRFPRNGDGAPGVKKQSDKLRTVKRNNEEHLKASQSLTSLYYELEDKSNSGKIMDDEYLEKMIRELSVDDNFRGIRNILNPGFVVKRKSSKHETPPEEYQYPLSNWSNDDHFKVICHKMKFSERPLKSGKSFSSDQTTASCPAR